MKKIVLLFALYICSGVNAQTSAKWENVYGGDGVQYGYGVRSCLDQGYVAIGSSGTLGVSDGYMVRVDSLGLVMWTKFYNGGNVDVLRSIRVLPDSGFIMAGYSNSGGHGGYDGWLLRTNKFGDTLWTKYIGTTDWDFFYEVYPTWDGGFVIAGGTYGQGAGDEDMYFVKTDSNGDTLWTKTYGGTRVDEARAIIQTKDSLLVACGYSMSLGDTTGDSWVLRLDQTGDTLWTKKFGNTTGMDKAFGVAAVEAYGWLLIVGETEMAGDASAYLWYLQMNGNNILSQTYGPAGEDFFSAIVSGSNNHYAMAGLTNGLGAGNGDMLFNSDISITTFGDLQADVAYGIDTGNTGGYILCGYSQSFGPIVPDMFLVKTDTNGYSTNILGIREPLANEQHSQVTIFPNPVSSIANFYIDSKTVITNDITVNYYDIGGRSINNVPTSEPTHISSGSISVRADFSALNAGIYFCTVNSAELGELTFKFVVTH